MRDFVSKVVLLCWGLCVLGCSTTYSPNESNRSFLVLDAYAAVGRQQPTWVGLYNGRTSAHISAIGGIASLEPGTWTIEHFDYTRDVHSNVGNRQVKEDLPIRLKAGKIYYFGLVEVHRFRTEKGDYSVSHDSAVLERACQENPALFEKYPLVMLYGSSAGKELKLDCAVNPK